jgi:hypothetical protein
MNATTLSELDHAHVWHPFTPMRQWREEPPLIIELAEGFHLIDTEGRRYIDAAPSLWCNVHGHRVPEIDAAIRDQLDRVAHSTLLGLASPPSIELAARLAAVTPGSLSRVFYSDLGATALEAAFKMAVGYWYHRGRPEKNRFVALAGGYHGDTTGSMSVGFSELFHRPFASMVFDTTFAPVPDPCRPPAVLARPVAAGCWPSEDEDLGEALSDACLAELEAILRAQSRETAAIVVEPLVQGASGMVCQPPGFLRGVAELARDYGVLLIADEVAVGFGRTGRMFACEHEGVEPDLIRDPPRGALAPARLPARARRAPAGRHGGHRALPAIGRRSRGLVPRDRRTARRRSVGGGQGIRIGAMFRKAPSWIAFALVSVALGVFAVAYFASAFPLVTLDLEMDRETALAEARRLAGERGWGPEGFRQAASFGLEADVQSYVELEAGGHEAFGEMIRGDLYSPYTWRVRLFRPGETVETAVLFTPGGRPYGFEETLPEDEPGASLSEREARRLAEDRAAREWNVDLSAFERVEDSQEARPGGRTDHTFVYERRGARVGEEGRYRLGLTVSGDRFTGLRHSVKIPEAFSRGYEEMRSANNFIALGASLATLLLYLGGGCGVGLFFLFRMRWVLWKKALAWAVLVAFLQALVGLNQWPLAWMDYDTALSTANFVLRNLALQAAVFVGSSLLFVLAFVGAESLTRRAFPSHPRFWELWTRRAASSPQVLGRTVAGYLLVAFFFAYEVTLYFFSHRVLGWWSPSDALFNPDSLATYFPWLPAVAISLQAGFMEECLFRAVPLAGAALLGRRFGRARLWIGAALLVQAFIFGAAHANYPTQPAFARLVELVLPSIGFGLVYLRFGLLPVIVLHFAFDVVWFALPLFVSQAPGAWVDQAVVVALTLVPLLVVVAARLRSGRFRDLGEEGYNQSWTPPAAAPAAAPPAELPARTEIPPRLRTLLAAAGVAGLAVWILTSPFTSLAPRLEVGRAAAEDAAAAELAERGVELGGDWKTFSAVQAELSDAHRFVWTRGGEEELRDALGRYLAEPRWWVRRARFEGEVAERAEEYQVWVSGGGEATRFLHRVPEGRAGADLAADEARGLARAAIAEQYGSDLAGKLEEISATPAKQPERRDWTFVFKDPAGWAQEEGEARVGVDVAGDEVAHVYRFLHLPEDWEREERNRATLLNVVRLAAAGGLFLAFMAAVGVAVVQWARKKLAVGMFLRFGALTLVLGFATFVNAWPAGRIFFSTAQPYELQMLIQAVGVIGVGIAALGVAFAVGLVHGLGNAVPPSESGSVLPGLGLGALMAGLAALGGRLGPSLAPPWADFSGADAWVPSVATASADLMGFVTGTTLFLLLFAAVDRLSGRWSRRKGHTVALFLAAGLVFAGARGVDSLPAWLAAGAVEGLILLAAYVLVLRHDLSLVPPAVAVTFVLGALPDAMSRPYPGVLAGHAAVILLVALLAVYWTKAFRTPQDDPQGVADRGAADPAPPPDTGVRSVAS